MQRIGRGLDEQDAQARISYEERIGEELITPPHLIPRF
jgi:hypothetical protein